MDPRGSPWIPGPQRSQHSKRSQCHRPEAHGHREGHKTATEKDLKGSESLKNEKYGKIMNKYEQYQAKVFKI